MLPAMIDQLETAIHSSYRPSSGDLAPVRAWTLEALARGDGRAEGLVRRQTREIARALAAHTLATAPDAEVSEYEARIQTLSRTIWPEEPLQGFSLQSSLGAFLVARLAASWAPPTQAGPRSSPLSADALKDALVEAGLGADLASGILGDWPGASPSFSSEQEGVDIAVLAGLAEGTLGTDERNLALSEIATSPRSLARLVSIARALSAVRRLLPILPPEGETFDASTLTGLTAVSLGLPDRALDLLGHNPDDSVLRGIAELAQALLSLRRGDRPRLSDDLLLPLVPEGTSERPSESPQSDGPEDDVLDIVEEKLSTGAVSAEKPALDARPALADFSREDWPPADISGSQIDLWMEIRKLRRAPAAQVGSILGLSAAPEKPWVPPRPIPPEKNALLEMLTVVSGDGASSDAVTVQLSGTALAAQRDTLDRAMVLPLVPNVRAVLRAITLAAEGQVPSREAVTDAGDLDWAVKRARAIALTLGGEFERAVLELTGLGGPSAPEGRWAYMMHLRYQGRTPVLPKPEEARRVAAELVLDLAHQFGRTVAGSV